MVASTTSRPSRRILGIFREIREGEEAHQFRQQRWRLQFQRDYQYTEGRDI